MFWDRGRWWKALLAVVGYIVLYQAAGFALAAVVPHRGGTIFSSPGNVFLGLGAGPLIGAVILVAFALSVQWLRPLFAKQPVRGRWWMWVFVALVIIPIVLRFGGIDYGSYERGVVMTTLLAGLLIGFTEELLYRGIVVKILREGGHRELSVAVLSSLFFALSHSVNFFAGMSFLTVALTMVYTFGFGMMMYLVMRVTRHLVWAMLLHAFTDPTTFLANGAVDASVGAAHSPLLELANPFNIVFVIAGLVVLFFIRGKAEPANLTGTL